VKALERGGEAVKHAVGGRFDLAILDWELPDLDGIDVLRAGADDYPCVFDLAARSRPTSDLVGGYET
jgi:DNA-binding response OmpR family regulator